MSDGAQKRLAQLEWALTHRQLEASCGAVGALLRGPLLAGEQRERLEQLIPRGEQLARQAGAAVRLGREQLTQLEQGLQALGPREQGELSWLELREELACIAAGAARLGADPRVLDPLRQGLGRLDRLGRERLKAFLHLNPGRAARRAELGPEAAEDWWWADRVTCDVEAVAALDTGLLPAARRDQLVAHLPGCPDCQQELAWTRRLDPLLGAPQEDHPGSAEILAHAAGEGTAEQRQQLARHLSGCARCRQLLSAAAAGLQEAEELERGLALLQQAASTASGSVDASVGGDLDAAAPLHLPLVLPAPPAPRALAADGEALPPLAQDRQLLLERPGAFRLVLHRLGAEAELALFAEQAGAVELGASLDQRPLEVSSVPEGWLCSLGPLRQLGGATLRVTVTLKGQAIRRSYTLAPQSVR